jgi:hypothetical protein
MGLGEIWTDDEVLETKYLEMFSFMDGTIC